MKAFTFKLARRTSSAMPKDVSLLVDIRRAFLDAPLDCEEFCTPKVHTLDHMNKRARFTEWERKCTHTAYHWSSCCCPDRPLRLAKGNSSRNGQRVLLQTSHYTACCLLGSSTFIHYRPLYLHVASHWFNSNVSAWRQANSPLAFNVQRIRKKKKKGDVAERLTQSGPVIKSCRPLEVSRSRIPFPPPSLHLPQRNASAVV